MAISNSTATQKSVEGAEVAVSVKARKNSSKVRGGTLKGVGMLTPERTFEWAGELYEAGRTRVSPVHPVCSSPAARFLVPAWEGEDSEEVRAVIERSGRSWEAATSSTSASSRTPVSSRPLYGLDYGPPAPPRHAPPRHDDHAVLKAAMAPAAAMIVSPEFEEQVYAAAAARHAKNAAADAATRRED